MSKMKKSKIPVILVGTLLAASFLPGQSAPPKDLDDYAGRALKAFQVPGMALAIVKDGRVVVAKGYGVKKMGAPDLVDAETLFAIGSNTKAFTTAILASLADEG
jgi:CubicO group peptidase (beta-lactamase class C family)